MRIAGCVMFGQGLVLPFGPAFCPDPAFGGRRKTSGSKERVEALSAQTGGRLTVKGDGGSTPKRDGGG